jgi:hypothetical protein
MPCHTAVVTGKCNKTNSKGSKRYRFGQIWVKRTCGHKNIAIFFTHLRTKSDAQHLHLLYFGFFLTLSWYPLVQDTGRYSIHTLQTVWIDTFLFVSGISYKSNIRRFYGKCLAFSSHFSEYNILSPLQITLLPVFTPSTIRRRQPFGKQIGVAVAQISLHSKLWRICLAVLSGHC